MSVQVSTRDEWKSVLGESIHTGFRKGTERPGSGDAWRYIADLDSEMWDDVLGWVVYCLEEMDMIEVAERDEEEQ